MALYWNPENNLDQLLTAAFGLERTARNNLPLDIRQTEEAFWIEASVPGFRPEDVEITLDENVLTIHGTRHPDETRGGYVQRERQLTSVHRHVGLPAQVKAEEITARFENGILTVMVPRAQRAQPKRIPVTLAEGQQTRVIDAPAPTVAGAN
ncbi:MAG: Hsp20/alpha crystallin family protein [Candidatus Dormiibacterota bacterium]